jgi:glycosyltransferase involved in cell wall biosynthesis
MEEHLARRADMVFVTSPSLLESKGRLNRTVKLVPNAVDYEAFSAVRDGSAMVPADVGEIEHPIAGYVGAINDKLDLPMLSSVAGLLPEWRFMLVGPISVNGEVGRKALADLRAMSNVHLLGRKEVEEVPHYVMACDVCLLPYRINEWTRNIDSLKVYEYMACGKPVVATDIPAAQRYAEVIRIAGSPQAFAEAISTTSRRDGAAQRLRRQELAERNTWDQRVEALSAAIEAHLEKSRADCGRLQ